MFARLFGHSGDTTRVEGRLAARALGARGSVLARRDMSEAQFSNLLTYWAFGDHRPRTATLRPSLWVGHLAVRVGTDAALDAALLPILGADSLLPTARQAMMNYAKDRAFLALREAMSIPLSTPDQRVGVGVRTLSLALDAALAQPVEDPGLAALVQAATPARLKEAALSALTAVSHEYLLAERLRETARGLLAMEEQMARNSLPPEDMYELRLRRDVFKADLALYTRLTRAVMGVG